MRSKLKLQTMHRKPNFYEALIAACTLILAPLEAYPLDAGADTAQLTHLQLVNIQVSPLAWIAQEPNLRFDIGVISWLSLGASVITTTQTFTPIQTTLTEFGAHASFYFLAPRYQTGPFGRIGVSRLEDLARRLPALATTSGYTVYSVKATGGYTWQAHTYGLNVSLGTSLSYYQQSASVHGYQPRLEFDIGWAL